MDELRRGWCPGALRPMMARDGLLVRLRLTGGILPASKGEALADLAVLHGNGLFDLSARGNLQMRGATETSLPDLHDGLSALDLLDRSVDHEAVRNVIASPLAGLAAWLDIRPLVASLERAIVDDPTSRTLPGKFAFLVDDGSEPSLHAVEADLRFDWHPGTALFSIGIGGTAGAAVRIGTCRAEDLVARAVDLAGVAARLLLRMNLRRLRQLVPLLGPDEVTRAFARGERAPAWPSERPTRVRDWVGPRRTIRHVELLGLAAPFGRMDAAMLRAIARCAAATSIRELRLTPWRIVLIPGTETCRATRGFIVDRTDPRLGVAACVGDSGCVRGTTSTHEDAAYLAAMLPKVEEGIALHVSGCAKGCAKPSATPITLVAEGGCYTLVRNGRASDAPAFGRLSIEEVAALLKESA